MLVFNWPLQVAFIMRRPAVDKAVRDSQQLSSSTPEGTDGSIPDIRFSQPWRDAAAGMSAQEKEELILLGFTADGVQPYGKWSTKYSTWFFYAEILALPPELRRRPENLLIISASLGGEQPKDMQSALRTLTP